MDPKHGEGVPGSPNFKRGRTSQAQQPQTGGVPGVKLLTKNQKLNKNLVTKNVVSCLPKRAYDVQMILICAHERETQGLRWLGWVVAWGGTAPCVALLDVCMACGDGGGVPTCSGVPKARCSVSDVMAGCTEGKQDSHDT
jgi:hypothetical protein